MSKIKQPTIRTIESGKKSEIMYTASVTGARIIVPLRTSALGHKRTSASTRIMSGFGGKAVVTGPKADIAALRSAIGGKADVDLAVGDVC